jgi:hypothetical protein
MSAEEDLKVFIASRELTCEECCQALGRNAWICLLGERGALCLVCADLDHLVFLPSGNTALTRRARKHSVLAAVVLKWSHARKRYERQGLLVEEPALARAESVSRNAVSPPSAPCLRLSHLATPMAVIEL